MQADSFAPLANGDKTPVAFVAAVDRLTRGAISLIGLGLTTAARHNCSFPLPNNNTGGRIDDALVLKTNCVSINAATDGVYVDNYSGGVRSNRFGSVAETSVAQDGVCTFSYLTLGGIRASVNTFTWGFIGRVREVAPWVGKSLSLVSRDRAATSLKEKYGY